MEKGKDRKKEEFKKWMEWLEVVNELDGSLGIDEGRRTRWEEYEEEARRREKA